jgi:hypothetical protein
MIFLVYQIYRLVKKIRSYKQIDRNITNQFLYFLTVVFRVLIIILLLYFSINLVERFYVDIQYNKPIKALSELIQDAKEDKEFSSVILSDEEWVQHKPNSVFKISREQVAWEKIKHIFQSAKILVDMNRRGELQLKAAYHVKKGRIHDDHQIIFIHYIPKNTEKIYSISFGLEIIDGEWMVVSTKIHTGD